MRLSRFRALLVAAGIAGALLLTAATSTHGSAAGWLQLAHPPPFNPGVMFLLTDGRVMVQELTVRLRTER